MPSIRVNGSTYAVNATKTYSGDFSSVHNEDFLFVVIFPITSDSDFGASGSHGKGKKMEEEEAAGRCRGGSRRREEVSEG